MVKSFGPSHSAVVVAHYSAVLEAEWKIGTWFLSQPIHAGHVYL